MSEIDKSLFVEFLRVCLAEMNGLIMLFQYFEFVQAMRSYFNIYNCALKLPWVLFNSKNVWIALKEKKKEKSRLFVHFIFLFRFNKLPEMMKKNTRSFWFVEAKTNNVQVEVQSIVSRFWKELYLELFVHVSLTISVISSKFASTVKTLLHF